MERMSALDAAFWDFEDDRCPLHIGGVAVFEGPVPSPVEMGAVYERGIASDPRLHRKMQRALRGLGRPSWVDDPRFDPEYHLRRTALPSPGTEEQFHRLVERLMSVRVDPHRPPWESWVIEGLADGRWALLIKVHHSMVDGLGAMELFKALLDPPDEPHNAAHPAATPQPVVLLRMVGDYVTAVRSIGQGLVAAGLQPRHTTRAIGHGLGGLAGFARGMRPLESNSLIGPLGSPRRYRTLTVELADVAAIRAALGGSVNDVVLALVSRGFRELLVARGEHPGPRSVRCLVPVSTRASHGSRRTANAVSALFVELPLDFADVVESYHAMRARMAGMKASYEVEAAQFGVALADLVPAPLVSAVLRMVKRMPQRAITTITTNVPGPRESLSLLDRQMVAMYPYVPIADRVRVTVAVTSYAGRLQFGVTGDRDSVPDIDTLVGAMAEAAAELAKEAANTSGEGRES